jgi:hypothetical protein
VFDRIGTRLAKTPKIPVAMRKAPDKVKTNSDMGGLTKKAAASSELELSKPEYKCGKYYFYLSRWIQVFPPIFHCLFLLAKLLMPRYSAPFISMDPLLCYINRCTSHHSVVLFWIQFC